jgi:hypothetical protein
MAVWAVTGPLGSGKGMCAVGKIRDYINDGRRVATNMDLYLEKLVNPYAKNVDVTRLSDLPTSSEIEALGQGYEGEFQGDHKNGLIVLDECMLWLNSRDWNDKDRKKLVQEFVHLRHRRWDMILQIQDIDSMDKQFRNAFCEHICYVMRLDRMPIPILSPIFKFFWGDKLPLPRIHIANVMYQAGRSSEKHVDTWRYRGDDIKDGYDTEQEFNPDSEKKMHSLLTPWHIYGRRTSKLEHMKYAFKNVSWLTIFSISVLLGGATGYTWSTGNSPDRGLWTCNDDWEQLFDGCDITKKDVQDWVASRKSEGDELSSDSLLQAEEDKVSHPLDGVKIAGSDTNGSQYFYITVDSDDNVIDTMDFGYKLYDINQCKAVAVNLSDRKDRFEIFHSDQDCTT